MDEVMGSNKALQATATRCAFTFFMIKTVPELLAPLPVAAAELVLVRPMKTSLVGIVISLTTLHVRAQGSETIRLPGWCFPSGRWFLRAHRRRPCCSTSF